jgi:hypothetical protein
MQPDHHASWTELEGFQWQKLNVTTAVDRDLLESLPSGIVDAQMSVTDDYAMSYLRDQLCAKLRAYVLGYKLPGHTVTRRVTTHWQMPASWWQHFKADHANSLWFAWFVRWRPVRMVTRCSHAYFRATWKDMAVYPWQAVAPNRESLRPALRHVLLDVEERSQPW